MSMQTLGSRGLISVTANTPVKMNDKVLKLTMSCDKLNGKTVKTRMMVYQGNVIKDGIC